jgi:hypothetical protein
MTSTYLQLNLQKRIHNKMNTFTQETNTTSDRFEDKTKSSLQLQMHNNKKNRFNFYLKRYENYFHKKLVIKYNVLPQEFSQIQLNNFIIAKYCHNLAAFKESLIYNDIEEYLRKYYKIIDSILKIPKFAEFYKSYLVFFCFPTFAELKINDLIEDMVENKAKVFYNDNYKDELKEEKKQNNQVSSVFNTIIFTKKVRHELSRRNTLTDLSKTTILNKNLSNKSSINSINTITKIMNYLDNKDNNDNFSLVTQNQLLTKEDKGFNTERPKIKKIENIKNNINGNENSSNCTTDRNNKKNSIINFKNNIHNKHKTKISNANNLIQILKNQCLINQLYKKNKKIKNNKKINNNINNDKYLTKNNLFSKIKNNKRSIIKTNNNLKINEKINNILTNNKDDKGKGNYTEREKKNIIPSIPKNKKFDQQFRTFLKIALNFRKLSPNEKPLLNFKKMNNHRNSKIPLTDRNKSSFKKKSEININSYINNNLTEIMRCNKKSSIKEIGNKSKKSKKMSRNYRFGLDEFKTSIIKNSLKNTLKECMNQHYCNTSKKTLNPYDNYKSITKDYFTKKDTQKIKTSKDATSFVKKEKSHFSTINSSHINSKNKTKTKKLLNFKTLSIKKAILPLNKITSYNYLKKRSTLNSKIPNI